MADKKKRFALGITHLLDNVPHKEALGIKRELMAELNRTTYYRCYRKERLLKPKEQEYIRQKATATVAIPRDWSNTSGKLLEISPMLSSLGRRY